ncbi:MAG: amidohydrolase family protein [Gemmatimonadota bacterium]|nr:amidohydrolase family protein [Gemmatimonadota bacterium]
MNAHRVALPAIATLLLAAAPLFAQHDPRVEPADVYAITGATIHTLAGPAIEGGTLVLRDGEIEAVGSGVEVPADARVIDAEGLHVYPGLVDAYSRLGLTEIGAVEASQDLGEITQWNPHLTSATAIHPASAHLDVARANGITHALVAPGEGGGLFSFAQGGEGGIPGRAAFVHLDGWTVEEMEIDDSVAMVIQWPTIRTETFDFSTFDFEERPYTEAKEEFDENVRALEEWFEAAAHYRQAVDRGDPARFERNLKLEHLARTLGGGLPVIAVANEKRSIESALEFAERHDLDLVIAGGDDAREVKEELARREVPVILGPTQSLPDEEDDPYHSPMSLAGELHEAGVTIAFGTFTSADSRTVPYEAATAVPFGLPREAALRAITVNPAAILGVGDRLGTIEAGKIGNVIVTGGDPLEIRTPVEWVFIDGMPVDRSNRHRALYREYRARP